MPWSTSTGRKTDYTGTVIKSSFEHTEFDSGGSQNSLHLTFLLEDGTEWNENYSIGGKWFPSPDGTIAEHEDGVTNTGEFRTFSKQSKYGAFIDAAMAVVPIEILQERGDPVYAKVWLGMTFHMNEVAHPRMKNPETKEPVMMNLPTEFLGIEQSAEEAESAIHDQLVEIAQSVANHDEFMEKTLTLPGVEGNNSLVMQIADPDGLYQELKK